MKRLFLWLFLAVLLPTATYAICVQTSHVYGKSGVYSTNVTYEEMAAGGLPRGRRAGAAESAMVRASLAAIQARPATGGPIALEPAGTSQLLRGWAAETT